MQRAIDVAGQALPMPPGPSAYRRQRAVDAARRTSAVIFGERVALHAPQVIAIVGTITDKTAASVRRQLAEMDPGQEVAVAIDSLGGQLEPAQAIYGALRARSGRVCTRALSACASAATVILLAGDWREALSGSLFMIHQVEVAPNADARWTAAKHRRTADIVAAYDTDLVRLYAGRTGVSESRFRAEMSRERGMTAATAKSFGLIHHALGTPSGQPYGK